MHLQYTDHVELAEMDKEGSVIVVALSSAEDRGAWWLSLTRAKTIILVPLGNPVLQFKIGERVYTVRNGSELLMLLNSWELLGEIYIDITTLPYEIWAILIRKAIFSDIKIKCIYVEPRDYSSITKESALREFELSDHIAGIENLPGFSQFIQDDEPFGLVVLLGFEGARFGYLVEKLEAERASKLIPIIGVPGFRPEFVRYAFEGNIHTLEKTGSFRAIRYARANCPFTLFGEIREICSEISEPLVKFGLIGTRPHGLGAVLYSLLAKRKTSLVFDFPTKKVGRSKGIGRISVYDISTFCAEVGHVS